MLINSVAPFRRLALNLRWRVNANERSQDSVTEASYEFSITAWKAKPPFSLQRRDFSSINSKSLFSRELNVFDLHGSPLQVKKCPILWFILPAHQIEPPRHLKYGGADFLSK